MTSAHVTRCDTRLISSATSSAAWVSSQQSEHVMTVRTASRVRHVLVDDMAACATLLVHRHRPDMRSFAIVTESAPDGRALSMTCDPLHDEGWDAAADVAAQAPQFCWTETAGQDGRDVALVQVFSLGLVDERPDERDLTVHVYGVADRLLDRFVGPAATRDKQAAFVQRAVLAATEAAPTPPPCAPPATCRAPARTNPRRRHATRRELRHKRDGALLHNALDLTYRLTDGLTLHEAVRVLGCHPGGTADDDGYRLYRELGGRDKRCFGCSAVTRCRVCERCRRARYCCAACQRADWPTHMAACAPRA